MTELYFRLGAREGFTSNTTADKKEGLGIPLRELTQNSLDATEDGVPCRVEIIIDEIAIADIPHIDEYKESLEKAIQTQKHLQSYNSQQEQIVKNLKSELSKSRIHILMFADDGGGMDRDGLDALIEQRSRGKSKGSGGSFGVGHLKSYDLSSLRYVLYATRHDNVTLFTGVPILAGFQDDDVQRGNIGRIIKKIPDDERNPIFDYPNQLPNFMECVMQDDRQGTVVCVVGLTDKTFDDYETVIASHFFSALLHGRLSINIRRGQGFEGHSVLNSDGVEHVLVKVKEGRNARFSRGEILAGRHTWQSFLAVRDSNPNEIELSNGDRVITYIHTGDIIDSSIALIRSDMLVARHDTMLSPDFNDLRKSNDFEPFALVIDINQQQAGNELFDLVKAAEGPYHNELKRGELSEEDYVRLRALFKELAGKVRGYLPKIDRTGFDLPIFDSIAASTNEDRKAKPVNATGIGLPGGKRPPRPGPGPDPRPRPPPMFGRPAEAKIEARTEQTEEGWRISVRIVPTSDTQPRDKARLAFAVAEDRDNGIAGDWLIPKEVLVNGHPGAADDRVVPLGRLARLSPVTVEAVLARPLDSARDATVGVLPVLSLKQEVQSKMTGDDSEGAELV